MMSKQLNLFETPKPEGYPVSMTGYWRGKYLAFAIVDTPEHEEELRLLGYEIEADDAD